MFAMVGARPDDKNRTNGGALDELPVRYLAYYSREFFRATGILLALQSDGNPGVARLLHKRLRHLKKTKTEHVGKTPMAAAGGKIAAQAISKVSCSN